MENNNKSKEQLLKDIDLYKAKITELEKSAVKNKIAEEDLKASEARFKSLFESMIEGVCLHELIYDKNDDPIDYRILDVNPAYESILDLKKKDVLNKLGSKIYGTKEAPYLEEYAEVTKTGKSYRFEVYFPPMDKHFLISVFSPDKNQFATVFWIFPIENWLKKRYLEVKFY